MKILDIEVQPHPNKLKVIFQEGSKETKLIYVVTCIVDKVPDLTELQFKAVDVTPKGYNDKCMLYFAETESYISFYYHNARDQQGFGGRTFDLKLDDGSIARVRGPWSSRPGYFNGQGFTQSIDVDYKEKDRWAKDPPKLCGYITLEAAQREINKKWPDTYEFVKDISTGDIKYNLVKKSKHGEILI